MSTTNLIVWSGVVTTIELYILGWYWFKIQYTSEGSLICAHIARVVAWGWCSFVITYLEATVYYDAITQAIPESPGYFHEIANGSAQSISPFHPLNALAFVSKIHVWMVSAFGPFLVLIPIVSLGLFVISWASGAETKVPRGEDAIQSASFTLPGLGRNGTTVLLAILCAMAWTIPIVLTFLLIVALPLLLPAFPFILGQKTSVGLMRMRTERQSRERQRSGGALWSRRRGHRRW